MDIKSNTFNPKGKKVRILFFDSYLSFIKNSVGSKIFKNLYASVDGETKDIARDGDLSCDIFVSSILFLFRLIDGIQAMVSECVFQMLKFGWYEIKKPKEGAVIVWEAKKFPNGEMHKHIGFYIGNGRAISNISKKKSPGIHHWTFGAKNGKPKRKIEAIYWHKKLT